MFKSGLKTEVVLEMNRGKTPDEQDKLGYPEFRAWAISIDNNIQSAYKLVQKDNRTKTGYQPAARAGSAQTQSQPQQDGYQQDYQHDVHMDAAIVQANRNPANTGRGRGGRGRGRGQARGPTNPPPPATFQPPFLPSRADQTVIPS